MAPQSHFASIKDIKKINILRNPKIGKYRLFFLRKGHKIHNTQQKYPHASFCIDMNMQVLIIVNGGAFIGPRWG